MSPLRGLLIAPRAGRAGAAQRARAPPPARARGARDRRPVAGRPRAGARAAGRRVRRGPGARARPARGAGLPAGFAAVARAARSGATRRRPPRRIAHHARPRGRGTRPARRSPASPTTRSSSPPRPPEHSPPAAPSRPCLRSRSAPRASTSCSPIATRSSSPSARRRSRRLADLALAACDRAGAVGRRGVARPRSGGPHVGARSVLAARARSATPPGTGRMTTRTQPDCVPRARRARAQRARARLARAQHGQARCSSSASCSPSLVGAVVLGGVARGVGARGDQQRAADLAALAARAGDARRLPAAVRARRRSTAAPTRGTSSAPRTSRSARARRRATARAQRRASASTSPSRTAARSRRSASASPSATPIVGSAAGARVTIARPPRPSSRRRRRSPAMRPARASTAGRSRTARASRCAPTSRSPSTAWSAAARADGVAPDHHQRLPHRRRAGRACSRAHPDPKWVAPPGQSLHRLGTELDLGPPAAYGWLAAQRGALPLHPALLVGAVALRLHAQRRLDARWASARAATATAPGALPAFVPERVRAGDRARGAALERVGARCSPRSSTQESHFNPFARSPARARRASRSSCRARPRPTAWATRSTPSVRSTPRRT